jgi:tetratricopeptide (TPR) repeat protein
MKKSKKLFSILFFLLVALHVQSQSLKDAIHLTDNEQFEAAGSVFRNLIVTEPSNGTNYYYSGENYLLNDQADSALMMFNKGLQVDPNNTLNTIGLAKIKLNKASVNEMKALSDHAVHDAEKAKKEYDALPNKTSGDQARLIESMQAKVTEAQSKYTEAKANVAEAIAMIDEAVIKAGSKNSRVLIEAADALINFKNYDLDKAKTYLDKAVALDAKNPEIQILYGDIYTKLNNGSLAAEYYNKALEFDKNSAKAIVSKGILYKRSTNYEGAAEEFQNAIKIDPSYAPAHRELGEIYYKLNKLDKAKEEYRTYLDLSKNNKSARIRYASFLYLSKDYSGAINEINQLSKFDPNNLTLLRIATYCYYEIKDSAKALSAVRSLFGKLTDENAAPIDYEYYGKILALNNQDSLAVIQLRKAFDMDNSRCDLLNKIYESYDKMKKNEEAAEALEEKIQNCKSATTLDYYYLGRSYLYAQQFGKADTTFSKLNEIAPTYAAGYLNRAKANSYIDSTSVNGLAKPFYEKYIELTLSDTSKGLSIAQKNGLLESYRYLAYYYALKNENSSTKSYLKKILEIDPNDQKAKEGIEGIDRPRQQPKKP